MICSRFLDTVNAGCFSLAPHPLLGFGGPHFSFHLIVHGQKGVEEASCPGQSIFYGEEFGAGLVQGAGEFLVAGWSFLAGKSHLCGQVHPPDLCLAVQGCVQAVAVDFEFEGNECDVVEVAVPGGGAGAVDFVHGAGFICELVFYRVGQDREGVRDKRHIQWIGAGDQQGFCDSGNLEVSGDIDVEPGEFPGAEPDQDGEFDVVDGAADLFRAGVADFEGVGADRGVIHGVDQGLGGVAVAGRGVLPVQVQILGMPGPGNQTVEVGPTLEDPSRVLGHELSEENFAEESVVDEVGGQFLLSGELAQPRGDLGMGAPGFRLRHQCPCHRPRLLLCWWPRCGDDPVSRLQTVGGLPRERLR